MKDRKLAPTYRGVMRSGAYAIGPIPPGVTVAEFVERKFRARWRSLTVHRGVHEMGAIAKHPDTGRRIWWAESDSLDDEIECERDGMPCTHCGATGVCNRLIQTIFGSDETDAAVTP